MKTALPTIGIRPTIDGRRLGVRESLEDQTMNMAKAAAALIEANIRHASGEPVKCVIADTCIGGPAEAAACADKFKANNVGVSLAVTPCWCYGSETFDMDPFTPKAIWGFNGTERPGAVYLAAALAGLNQKGFPAFSIYGKDVQDATDTSIPEDVAEKNPALLPRRPHRSHPPRKRLSFHRRLLHGHCRFHCGPVFLGKLPGHPRTGRGHDGSAPPHGPENL